MDSIHHKNIRFNIIVASVVWFVWIVLLGPADAISYVTSNWEISVTMIFGSLIAGATSEGGGAVAFPVFTKILEIHPHDAKVFALAIQSVGMTAASLFIVAARVTVDWRVILWAGLGGIPGIIIGSGILAPISHPSLIKLTFTMLVSSFAISLLFINRRNKSRHPRIPKYGFNERSVLFVTGIIGGILSGLVGNGIDIITFSVMVLLFRISEKVATPTSVILMATNSIVGFALHLFVYDDFSEVVKGYWLAAIPIVVIGAPIGAMFCARFSRETIVHILLSLIAIEFVSSLIIIPLNYSLILYSSFLLMFFSLMYYWMCRIRTYEIPIY